MSKEYASNPILNPGTFVPDAEAHVWKDGRIYIYGSFDLEGDDKYCSDRYHVYSSDNMIEIEPDSILQPLSVAEHEFHEGSSMRKINGKYYYLFTDTHRHGRRATSLGYAVSDNPMTGFQYGGIIIDNFGCDPETWNNHGSMECFNGQWYLFYHRSTHGSNFSRHVCVEPITINADGSIPEVKMTSSGAGEPFKANSIIPAYTACGLTGSVIISKDATSENKLVLNRIHNGDTAVYRYILFHKESSFQIKYQSTNAMRVEIYIDDWYYTSLCTPASDEYTQQSAPISCPEGIHTLTLKFFGNDFQASLDEIVFQ